MILAVLLDIGMLLMKSVKRSIVKWVGYLIPLDLVADSRIVAPTRGHFPI